MKGVGIYKVVVFVAVMCAAMTTLYAQLDDTQMRNEIILSYNPTKKLGVSGSYRLDLNENISQFRRSNIEFGANYEVIKWLRLHTSYRYITSYNKDQHRFNLGFSLRKTTLNKKFQYQFKSTLQYSSDYLDREYWKYNDPKLTLRLRARTKFNFHKKWSTNLFAESFFQNFSDGYRFYRMRYGTELEYSPKKRHTLSVGYFFQHEFNRRKPTNLQNFSLNYEYEFKKKKKNTNKSKPASTSEESSKNY